MPKVTVQTNFDCKHSAVVEVDLDDDVEVPAEVRGLGKCGDCMDETNLIAISGVQPQASGRLVLDSIFLMPIE
ncbi:MAG TPA: hypothetical protein VG815_15125 [Chloroflexota bacterium]|nr:hypothetical protein [Chloroflexota bacterium]